LYIYARGGEVMSVNWHDLLLAWLHEPPDQVLEPQGSPTRAARYASAVFGHQYPLDKFLEILPEAIPLPLESGLPDLPDSANDLTDTRQTINTSANYENLNEA